jgi:hypothetical protein
MHKHTFRLCVCTLYEIEDLVSYTILCVEQDLILTVYPVERQVNNSDMLPVVAQLSTTAVYDARNFVGEHKL